jgi:4-hydroxythreonine-4-phosphate dehydrogenase
MKRLAITMGDPGGVGPEIIVKALNFASMNECVSTVVIGDRTPLEEALRLLKEPAKLRIIKSPDLI